MRMMTKNKLSILKKVVETEVAESLVQKKLVKLQQMKLKQSSQYSTCRRKLKWLRGSEKNHETTADETETPNLINRQHGGGNGSG